jgi:hypothetical protein
MQDKIDLQFIEGERACFRIAELAEEPIKGCFDIPHLKDIRLENSGLLYQKGGTGSNKDRC